MQWVWLIPLLPLLGAILAAVLGPRFLPRKCPLLVIAGVATSALLSVVLLIIINGDISQGKLDPNIAGYDWLSVGTLKSVIGAYVDPLTAVMLVTVSVVSLLVVIYSSGYMAGDRGYARFFAFMGLFIFSMLMLVLADNFLMLYIFWEAVGLCSYLLIGFYYQKPSAAAAAKKAFLVNRIGDFGFAIGILLIYLNFGTVNFFDTVVDGVTVSAGVFSQVPLIKDHNLITIIALCLFAGAVGKSAQLPLYVWLPDAMEGPSPVSALIHAATMVTAGVYMVVRCGAIFVGSPDAMLVVALVGGVTAFFAATIALVQTDIKRILAYSTISQLGYMFLAVGVGAASAAVFHLYTHAFFKALLFLAAGGIMHAMHDHIDLKDLGGLRKVIPWTHGLFLVGALALAGVPLFSGFFSKDAILLAALNHSTMSLLGWLGVITAALTAFYTFRCYFLVFHGPRRVPEAVKHPHETPIMNYAMIPLAIGAVIAGYVSFGGEHGGWIGSFLEHSASVKKYATLPSTRTPPYSHLTVTIISIVVVIGGIGLAAYIYARGRQTADKLAVRFESAHRLLANKYYVDEIYHAIFVRPLRKLGDGCFSGDNWVIDSVLWIITAVPRCLGALFGLTQRGNLQTYALLMLIGLAVIVFFVLRGM
jgi:NADH-quinone oxidoreductase subunit L